MNEASSEHISGLTQTPSAAEDFEAVRGTVSAGQAGSDRTNTMTGIAAQPCQRTVDLSSIELALRCRRGVASEPRHRCLLRKRELRDAARDHRESVYERLVPCDEIHVGDVPAMHESATG